MHAPGHLREGFVALVEGDEDAGGLFFFDVSKQQRWESMDADGRLWWLSGQLWSCTDCMPGYACAELDIPSGSTYAQAARHIRQSVLIGPS
jgi:hypothetical protein